MWPGMIGIRGDQEWGPTLTLSMSDVGSRDGSTACTVLGLGQEFSEYSA